MSSGSSRFNVILFLFLSLCLLNCNRSAENFIPDQAFKEYISAFTADMVSNESHIRILLANETSLPVENGQEVDADEELFSFSPEIKGKAVWVDKRTIEFIPEQRLAAGQTYKAEFFLSKVAEVPKDKKVFEFR